MKRWRKKRMMVTRDRPTRGYPHVGWAPPTRFSYKSHFPRGFWVGINRVISIFTHALFVCVGHEIVIFDTKKVLRVLIRHLLVATMQKVLCWRVHSELLWKKIHVYNKNVCRCASDFTIFPLKLQNTHAERGAWVGRWSYKVPRERRKYAKFPPHAWVILGPTIGGYHAWVYL